MQKAITLLATGLLAGSTTLFAQSSLPAAFGPQAVKVKAEFDASIQQVLRQVPAGTTANKTNGTKQRLTAKATYEDIGNGLAKEDSLTMKYSGERGSSFDFNSLIYNLEFTSDPYQSNLYAQFDTSFSYDPAMNTIIDTAYMTRNAGGKVTRMYNSRSSSTVFTYDAQGRITTEESVTYDGTSQQWENDKKVRHAFDAQGRVAADTLYSWNTNGWELANVQSYTYGSNNLPVLSRRYDWDGTAFEPSSENAIYYNAANLPILVNSSMWDGSSYALMMKDSFHYANNAMLVYHATKFSFGAMLVPIAIERRVLNAAGLPDSIVSAFINDPMQMTYDTVIARVSYNSFSNPEKITRRDLPGTALRTVEKFYYTTYQTSQGVPLARERKSISLYPNPAGRELMLKPETNGQYQCIIVNAAGQSVMQHSGAATAGQAISLPVERLAPGQYWLQLQDASGTLYGAAFLKR